MTTGFGCICAFAVTWAGTNSLGLALFVGVLFWGITHVNAYSLDEAG